MKGLPPMWMHQGDELYALRGPGKNMTVLATAHSDPSNAGTGHDEPQLMALRYGQGRSSTRLSATTSTASARWTSSSRCSAERNGRRRVQ